MDVRSLPRLLVPVALPLVFIVGALAVGWLGSSRVPDARSALTSALDVLPADVQVAGFTDWAQIRRGLGLGSASTTPARTALTTDSAARDLSTRSVIGAQVDDMHTAYGWSAADVDWEVYGQARDGATMVVHLEDSVSLDAVRRRLRDLGYVRDTTAGSGATIWVATDATASRAGAELSSTLAAVAVLPRERLLVAADRPAYASTVLHVIEGAQASLLTVRAAADVASTLVGTATALLQDRASACESAALPDGDAEAAAQARAAIARAGALERPAYAGRALDDSFDRDQTLRLSLAFASPSEAAGQLRRRTALATGPFIGRDGRIEDSLALRGSGVTASTLTMRFAHDPDTTVYMTGSGPLLFGGCGV